MGAYRLGLTGGIGSGKSTVSSLLAHMGAIIVDADAISKATTAPGGSAIARLRAAFGGTMICEDGGLDRVQMRNLAFSDSSVKANLEAIIHPLVGHAIENQAQQAEIEGAKCIVFDIPLLVESLHWRKRLERILIVDCSEETQITRVVARNGLDEHEIRNILAVQSSRSQRRAAADVVVFNDDISIDDLRLHVQEIASQFGL
ncbi:MAG: dephospho-CoA kinase [Rhodoferax sp.]